MAQPALKEDPLLDELDRLPQPVQRQVRELVHALAVPGAGSPQVGLRFAVDSRPAEEGVLPPDAQPDSIVKQILLLISDGQLLTARRIAVEAAARFPGHDKLRIAERMLAGDGNPSVSSKGPERSTDEEYRWLQNPPDWAHGKWVALIGHEAIASADTLAELTESLKTKDLPQRPLVHRVD